MAISGMDFDQVLASIRNAETEMGRQLEVFVEGQNDEQVCSECRAIQDMTFTTETVPVLPYANCTNPQGCRCSLGADYEEDA